MFHTESLLLRQVDGGPDAIGVPGKVTYTKLNSRVSKA